MNNLKQIASIIFAIALYCLMTTSVFADDFMLSDDENIREMDLTLFASAILNGDIEVVNEAEDNEISFNIIYDNDIMNLNNDIQESINVTDQIVDIRKIETENSVDNTETFVATFICTNEYKSTNNADSDIMPLLNKKDEDIVSDVKIACSIVYDRVTVEIEYNKPYAYKIRSITGTYVSTSDPTQMTCSKLYNIVQAYGMAVESATSDIRERYFEIPQKDIVYINSPIKGQGYTTNVNQGYYFCPAKTPLVGNTYNRARTYFTIKRMTTSFTKEVFIDVGFWD